MIKSKKLLALGAVAALGFAACGSDDDEPAATDAPVDTDAAEPAATDAPVETEAPPAEAAGLICEVTDVGGVDDKGFNQLAFEGLEQAAAEFGFEARVVESASDADYAPNINSFIEAGCDLIVTVGFLLGDATAEAATNNPDQQFAIIDFGYEEPFPNVLTLNFDTAQPSFLAGYLAAGVSESGTIATFGGINIPTVTIFMEGYLNGANYYNEQKGTEVSVLGWDGADGTFAGNFENLDDGKNIASSFADEGADIILPVAGPVGLGSAAFATESGDALIIGVDNDLFISDPANGPIYLTSVLKKIDASVFTAVDLIVVQGQNGGAYLGTLENGGVGLAPYHDQEPNVPAELQAEIEALTAAIIAGDISAS
jgi:basic membrane protein A